MISLNLNNFLIYFSLAWGTNIALNLLYVIKRYIPIANKYDYPIDFKLRYKKNRLLGDSTTVIGLILVLSIFTALTAPWKLIPLSVYFGHLTGSFIKRRLNKNNGEFVPVIDHGDYMIITGFIFVALNYINYSFALLAIILTYLLHPIACFIAFKLKLRENPY